jgi:Flp pilus assembly protein TadG
VLQPAQAESLPHLRRHTIGSGENQERGAITVEWALAYIAIIIPLTFGIVFTAQLLWIWHSVGEWTRDAARYASTHCWQASGDNVTTWMRANIPPMPDQDQFLNGIVTLSVQYFSKDPDTGTLSPFSCSSECSTQCVPDTVTVAVQNFQYSTFLTYLGLTPIQMPDFQTTAPMEGAGCDPEQGICTP